MPQNINHRITKITFGGNAMISFMLYYQVLEIYLRFLLNLFIMLILSL